MAVSARTRFEVFKRDDFTCRYCGRKSPEVVLECDHIEPASKGGSDDPMNLATSCWECNRGKSNVLLSDVMTGSDPHDAAILMLERHRQLDEYNRLLEVDRERRARLHDELLDYWNKWSPDNMLIPSGKRMFSTLLKNHPVALIKDAMDIAIAHGKTRDLRYVSGVLKRWADESRVDVDNAA